MTALLSRGADVAEMICGARAYQPLALADHPLPNRAAARQAILRQGMLLLQSLREQKQGVSLVGEMP
jgi:hypothetical protein